jgi:hypothetical protein
VDSLLPWGSSRSRRPRCGGSYGDATRVIHEALALWQKLRRVTELALEEIRGHRTIESRARLNPLPRISVTVAIPPQRVTVR